MATKPRYLKTPMQRWIGDKRKDLGLTPADLAVLTDVTEATARGWESRGRPSQEALAILERKFGEPAPADRVEASPDQAALIAALDRQSQAMEKLVELLGEVAQTQGRRLEKAEAILDGLVQRAIQDGGGHPAPHESAGSGR